MGAVIVAKPKLILALSKSPSAVCTVFSATLKLLICILYIESIYENAI